MNEDANHSRERKRGLGTSRILAVPERGMPTERMIQLSPRRDQVGIRSSSARAQAKAVIESTQGWMHLHIKLFRGLGDATMQQPFVTSRSTSEVVQSAACVDEAAEF